ncbi:MAG: hypothetical protein LBG27_08555 [Spirochaetaceae bacterium]|jgi:hypothetical protein|nr:hypothetical protein [Spirochaetaceae bacterium]
MTNHTVAVRIKLFLTLAAFALFAAPPLAAQMEPGFETSPDSGGVVITKHTGPGGAVVIPVAIGGRPLLELAEGLVRTAA